MIIDKNKGLLIDKIIISHLRSFQDDNLWEKQYIGRFDKELQLVGTEEVKVERRKKERRERSKQRREGKQERRLERVVSKGQGKIKSRRKGE